MIGTAEQQEAAEQAVGSTASIVQSSTKETHREVQRQHEVNYDKPRRRLYSVTNVLHAMREMGCTEDEIAFERVMMYADLAYRRFWTTGSWIM